MEAGVHLHLGQAVQLNAEEELKQDQEPVLIHLLKMEEVIVQGLLLRAKFATLTTVQLMEVGVHSPPGQAVQLLAEEEHKPEQEPVLTHLLNMVEVIVLVLRLRAKVATPTYVLFMEAGLHSHLGQAAQLIAEEEHKPEQEPVPTQLLNMVEVFAQEIPQKARLATPTIVQLMEVGLHSRPGPIVQLIAEEEHKPEQEPVLTHLLNMVEVIVLVLRRRAKVATPTYVLFMGAGLHSHLGQAAQLIAEEEHKPEQEPVLTHLLNMVEVIVLVLFLIAKVATPTYVLFMEAGLYSHLGQAAQLIAEEEHKPEQEPVLTQPLNTVEVFAQEIPQKARLATPTIVQLMEVGLHSRPGPIVQLIAVEVHKQDQEPVLILLLNMEGGIVLGILLKARLATPMTVQVTIPFESNY